MTEDTRIAKTVLRYQVDNARALSQMADVEKRLETLGDKTLILTRTNQAWARSLTMTGDSIRSSFDKAEQSASKLSQRLAGLPKTSAAAAAAKSQAAGNYNTLRDELMGGGETGATATAAGSTRFNPEFLRRTGGALNQLGLGAIGEPIARAGDVAEVAKSAVAGLGAMGISISGIVAIAAPATVAVGGVAAVIKIMGDDAQRAADRVKAQNAQLMQYWSDQDRARKEALTTTPADVDKTVQSLGRAIQDANNRLTFLIAKNQSDLDQAAPWQKGKAAAQGANDVAAYTAEIKKLQDEFNYQTKLLGPAVAQHDALTKQIEAETAAINARIQAAEQGVSRDIEQSRLLRTATPDQVKDLTASRQDEIRAIKDQMQGLEDIKDKSDAAKKEYESLADRLKTAQGWLQWYNDTLRDAADRNKAAADAAKKLADAEKARQDYYDQQPGAIADVVRKLNMDVKSIEEKGAADRAAILKRYNDATVESARKIAEGAEDTLLKLQRKQTDIDIELGRDQDKQAREAAYKTLDIQINAQREEAKAYREHYNELARIRQEAADREFDLILNRDFLGLFQSRRQTTIDLRNANTQFGQQEQERQIDTQNQLDDLRRSIDQQRNERLIAYRQQQEDARMAAIRELWDQGVAERRSLAQAAAARIADLNNQAVAQRTAITQRRQQAITEIEYAKMTYNARIEFLKAEQQTLIAQANAMLGAYYGSSRGTSAGRTAPVRTSAGGNMLDAGIMSVVHGGETFPGLGLFYALQGGAVTNNLSNQWNINGGSPEAIWHYIEPKVAQTVERMLT